MTLLLNISQTLYLLITLLSLPAYSDLGVFIGDMDNNGFAAKSGKLKHQDRILACNGVDFTKELTNARVEEIFTQMSTESLLRMAISRGLQTNLLYPEASNVQQKEGEESAGVASDGGVKDESMISVDGTPGTPKIGNELFNIGSLIPGGSLIPHTHTPTHTLTHTHTHSHTLTHSHTHSHALTHILTHTHTLTHTHSHTHSLTHTHTLSHTHTHTHSLQPLPAPLFSCHKHSSNRNQTYDKAH